MLLIIIAFCPVSHGDSLEISARLVSVIDAATLMINIKGAHCPGAIKGDILVRVRGVVPLAQNEQVSAMSLLSEREPLRLTNICVNGLLEVSADVLLYNGESLAERMQNAGYARADSRLFYDQALSAAARRYPQGNLAVSSAIVFCNGLLQVRPLAVAAGTVADGLAESVVATVSGLPDRRAVNKEAIKEKEKGTVAVKSIAVKLRGLANPDLSWDQEIELNDYLAQRIQDADNPQAVWLTDIRKNSEGILEADCWLGGGTLTRLITRFCQNQGWWASLAVGAETGESGFEARIKSAIDVQQTTIGNRAKTAVSSPDSVVSIAAFTPSASIPVPTRSSSVTAVEDDHRLLTVPGSVSSAAQRCLAHPVMPVKATATGILAMVNTQVERCFPGIKPIVSRTRRFLCQMLPTFYTPSMKDVSWMLESFGILGIKLGQMIYTMEGLAEEDRRHFAHLCYNVNQRMPFSEIEEILRDARKTIRYRERMGKLQYEAITIDSVDREPIGVGSIAQVHTGEITYRGKKIKCAFKFVRPEAEDEIKKGLDELNRIIALLTRSLGKDFAEKLFLHMTGLRGGDDNQIERKMLNAHLALMLNECDMGIEKLNLERLQTKMEEKKLVGFRVPKAYHATRNLLIMEYIPGKSLSEISMDDAAKADVLYNKAWQVWLKLAGGVATGEDNYFHGDFHPGNILWQEGAGQDGAIVFIDAAAVMKTCITLEQLDQFKEIIKDFSDLYLKINGLMPAVPMAQKSAQERCDFIKRRLVENKGRLRIKPALGDHLLSVYGKELNEKNNKLVFCLSHWFNHWDELISSGRAREAVAKECIDGFISKLACLVMDENASPTAEQRVNLFMDSMYLNGYTLSRSFCYLHQSQARMRRFEKYFSYFKVSNSAYRRQVASIEKKTSDREKFKALLAASKERKTKKPIKKEAAEKAIYSHSGGILKASAYKWYYRVCRKLDDKALERHQEKVESLRPGYYKYKNSSLLQDWVLCWLYFSHDQDDRKLLEKAKGAQGAGRAE